jgi:hypothetical protein
MAERLKQAQEAKRTIFGQRENRAVFDINLASLAFGISREKLDQLGKKYEELVISPQKNGLVEISIRSETENWKKEILGEIVGYFSSKKEIGAMAKRAYVRAYHTLQRQASQTGFDEEGDLEFCQSSLGDLWQELSPSEKRILTNQGLAPGDVYNALGIVGSDA